MLAMRLSGTTATTTAASAPAATVRVWCLSVSATTAATASNRWMLERRVFQQSDLDAAAIDDPL
jgi:hypothetical protein